MHRNFYNVEVPYQDGLLLYNILNQAFVYLDKAHKEFYLNPDLWEKDLQKLEEFKRLDFILDDDVDERALLLRNFNFARWKSNKVHVTVVPTSACNFRCPYCFVDFKRPNSLSDLYIPQIIGFILEKLKKLDASYLELNFFGGEPLLKIDFIFKLCDELKKSLPDNIKWATSMFTNGYLLSREYELLRKYKLF